MPNREAKRFKATDLLAPGREPTNREETIASFTTARERTIAFARTTNADLRLHFQRHPALGMIDGYQWLLFAAAHSERHTLQAREIVSQTASLARSTTLTPDEREFLVADLIRSRDRLEQLVDELSDRQLRFRPDGERWSIAEVIEHLAHSEARLLALVQRTVSGTEARPDLRNPDGSPRIKDLVYIMAMTNREAKRFEAPEGIRPVGEFGSPHDALRAFLARRATTIDYLRTTQDDLRAHFSENPGFGQMDAYQWLVIVSTHTDRHALQIEELKGDKNYPR